MKFKIPKIRTVTTVFMLDDYKRLYSSEYINTGLYIFIPKIFLLDSWLKKAKTYFGINTLRQLLAITRFELY